MINQIAQFYLTILIKRMGESGLTDPPSVTGVADVWISDSKRYPGYHELA